MKALTLPLIMLSTSLFISLVFWGCSSGPEHKLNGDKILFVTTSHSSLGKTGKKTGAYISEITHPYQILSSAGYQIDFVSPEGGEVPLDGMDKIDKKGEALLSSTSFNKKIKNSMRPEQVDSSIYKAIYFAGGHGAMFDLPDNKKLQQITREVYEQKGVVGAVCHGPAGLVNTRLSNGRYLIDGKKVAAFTNEEERAVGLSKVMPFLLETKMVQRGAKHSEKPNFKEHTVVSGRLVTGQNPASAERVGVEILKLLRQQKH
jgi:putative intracellular protease/amidase